jgi:hypothetical protein
MSIRPHSDLAKPKLANSPLSAESKFFVQIHVVHLWLSMIEEASKLFHDINMANSCDTKSNEGNECKTRQIIALHKMFL